MGQVGSNRPDHRNNRPAGVLPSVYHADSLFMAGFGAGPTSIALFFVYLNNFPNSLFASSFLLRFWI